ncbi:MAG: protein kinase [Deltaproteobacteria bacterium]|nr:MAG: protein kinase [Deltaproteobacteria bacterium]
MGDPSGDIPGVTLAIQRLLHELDVVGPSQPTVEYGDGDGEGGADGSVVTTVDTDGEWLPERYEDLGQIGMGGMGEVRRVLDRHLNRPVAMKIIRPSLVYSPETMARFLEEAQIAAQLEHPGIVPVHEAGRLADGRLYFTMKEVHGRTLSAVVAAVHAASTEERWGVTDDGWSLRRLVDAFGRVCAAMAYAHARGVIHRDLKPDNVMVGAFGEVLVLDWGLGKVLRQPPRPALAADAGPRVVTERSERDEYRTQAGDVGGTPAFMPPEQARGEIAELGPPADVYALGAILYFVLAGRPPYPAGTMARLLRAQESGPPPPPGRIAGERRLVTPGQGRAIPADLWAICRRALSFQPDRRHPDAGVLAAEVSEWLEGARRRERALAVVAEADALAPRIARLRRRADELDREAAELLARTPPLAPVRHKRSAWERIDQARQLRREAGLDEERMVQALHAALTHQPDLAEAHQRLARFYREAHARAEAAKDEDLAARMEIRLRAHNDGTHDAYLAGRGSLTLLTEPVDAAVRLRPFEEVDRRLRAGRPRDIGTTPILAHDLPVGSWLVELSAPGRALVRVPIAVRREQHWHGVAPGEGAPRPIHLPAGEDLAGDEAYVPAGWCGLGGDDQATRGLPERELWIDGFVIQRFPVTNRQYLRFLNHLVQTGREALALRHVPRSHSDRPDSEGPPAYGRRADGRFELDEDGAGDTWRLDWPVALVSWDSAQAYAAWRAEQTGQPWRLPSELEWEKAARGTDRRLYPWGNHIDPTWCLTQESHAGRLRPCAVTAFPDDESPYGVRGMGGNVRDWCREARGETERLLLEDRLVLGPVSPGGPDVLRVTRGGCWYSPQRDARVCSRVQSPQSFRAAGVGIRLVRSVG